MGNILVFAEHQKGKFPKSTLVALQAGKEAASKLGGDCLVAVLGSGLDAPAQEAARYGVAKVIAVDDPALPTTWLTPMPQRWNTSSRRTRFLSYSLPRLQ